MERKSTEKWVIQGKQNCKSYVFYENKVLDLTDFIHSHPGGVKAIKNYVYKDITNILFEVYPHQKVNTLARLMKFQVGLIPE
jgi:cytochrome b involved in lipid metabolism